MADRMGKLTGVEASNMQKLINIITSNSRYKALSTFKTYIFII
jgi:hypothetical protein